MTGGTGLDHIVVSAETLEDGVSRIEEALGLPLGPGGAHAVMGTHNRLLALGDVYLEVIAADPDAPPPAHARWYALDRFSGAPRLTNWVMKVPDLRATLARINVDAGKPLAVTRGSLSWEIAVRDDGELPFDNVFPALIEWPGAHPLDTMEDSGCRLRAFEISHPEADALSDALSPLAPPQTVRISTGAPGFRAEFETPHGLREITG